MAPPVDSLSPELALVDQELDRSARHALPDAPDCLTPSSGRRTSSWLLLAALALAALAVLIAGVVLSERTGTPSGMGAKPAAEGSSSAGDVLGWRPVRGASFYNVIFWRNGARALDLWPKKATVRVPPGRLAPGRYQWFVYPAFETKVKRRYGPVAAHGTLTI